MNYLSVLLLSLTIPFAANLKAADQSRDRAQTRDPSTHTTPTPEPQSVYGWELMTEQERREHQAKMRSLKTEQERDAFHAEHHKKMQERAKAQGKTLPDMPAAARGPGQGQGKGAAQAGPAASAPQQAQERVYGWELMTEQERREHQAKMRSLKTEQERDAFHAEHHKKMQERAKAQGKTLPDMPPAGRGPGQGQGKGQGQGPAPR